MLKSFDSARSVTVFTFPEPPGAPAPGELPPVTVHQLDWSAAGLEENEGKVALILDNVFTPEECQNLLKAAEDSASWSAATVRGGPEDKTGPVIDNYRKSGRILLIDPEVADRILSKLKPYLPEEAIEAPASKYPQFREDGAPGEDTRTGKRVQLVRLNERLSYLKYVPGDFFGPHYDGVYRIPDRSEISCLTLQLYLNGSKEDLEGGTTEFSTYLTRDVVVSVEPRPGRALIFEQETLRHCGGQVLKGEKYTIRTDLMFKEVSDRGDESNVA
ncbi:hypothetical protein FRC01_014467 [Tulasnella sp. 417]|nr:hypothetical protein FRC01_014467 [Tulasnella sp. 417]